MFFSDEIYLVTEHHIKDELNQFETTYDEQQTWAELTSIGAAEISDAGQNGHKAQGRAIVHLEDYSGEMLVRIPKGYMIHEGIYEIYRTFVKGDCIELYLKEKEGI